ncbi:mitochondrial inner membrane protease subunit 1-like [Octopus sinensis]|uniref:Mitochondrial inner membrane protease subunit 1-like n=1 Tax=Octopus sinensis TaxID=2607531 RepID=A0A6P7T4E2_9MOLL|nr:mitochondrial inner membrane protease subunit 1-like [Octopus sinensis]
MKWRPVSLLTKFGRFSFTLVQVGCMAYCVNSYIGSVVYCSGPSMEPTIINRDIVLTEQISVRRNRLHKGDVVVSVSPENPKSFICKRLVAFEGDCIFNDIDNSFQYVPRGHVWLEGDNKSNSSDSRFYGPVPYGLLKGRVCLKIWPLFKFGKLPYCPDNID